MSIAWWTSLACLLVAIAAERLHARHVRAIGPLMLGRSHRFTMFARVAPALRCLAIAAVAWGAIVLLTTPPQRWAGDVTADAAIAPTDLRRLMILLDVSPSMQLADAGGGKQTRAQRAAAVLDDLMTRVDLGQTRVTIVPFYTSALPVVVDAVDPNLVRFLATEPTLERAFVDGQTDLNASVNSALAIAKPWRAGSATLLVVTDGDAISRTAVADAPPSIDRTLVAGVGDALDGTFIDGHVSRQDPENLLALARRLRGRYVNVDKHLLPSDAIASVDGVMPRTSVPPAGQRDLARIAFAAGAATLALLPAMLSAFGTASRLPRATRTRPFALAEGVR